MDWLLRYFKLSWYFRRKHIGFVEPVIVYENKRLSLLNASSWTLKIDLKPRASIVAVRKENYSSDLGSKGLTTLPCHIDSKWVRLHALVLIVVGCYLWQISLVDQVTGENVCRSTIMRLQTCSAVSLKCYLKEASVAKKDNLQ